MSDIERDALADVIEGSGSLPCHASDQVNWHNSRGIADAILESDWLAEHDDRIRRETLRQVALKLDDLVEGGS